MKLSDRIRIIRVLRGYSQEYVADQLNMTQPAYSKIERNAQHARVTSLDRIAQVLNVSLPFLLDVGNPKYEE
jgi:transcriptional regulator with XRE-family HTH domain